MTRFIFLLSFILGQSLSADSLYPQHAVTRVFGTNQGDVGDCSTEAALTALETSFLEHGIAVRFSLFYHHAYTWMNQPSSDPNLNLPAVSAQDRQIMNQMGPWVPEFVWPEDGVGYNVYFTGVRPHVADAVVISPKTPPPNISQFGYQESFYSFAPGFSNSGTFAGIKSALQNHAGVTLSIHGDLFFSPLFSWNYQTGLLDSKYSLDLLKKAITQAHPSGTLQSTMDHEVTVIGYDDSLYDGEGYAQPGAFIVRNSWNDEGAILAVKQPVTDQKTQDDLNKMRLKIAPLNLPGYYAIPYQYVVDMFANPAPGQGYLTFQANYEAYYQAYNRAETSYETSIAPFVCNDSDAGLFSVLKQIQASIQNTASWLQTLKNPNSSNADKESADTKLYDLGIRELSDRWGSRTSGIFRYAKVSRLRDGSVDRIKDFYSGKFSPYYCPTSPGIFPSPNSLSNQGFMSALSLLSRETDSPIPWIQVFEALAEGVD